MADPAPYPGPFKEGDRGPAVVAIQGALHVWGARRKKTHPNEAHLRTSNPTGDWLHPTTLQIGHCQQVHGLEVTNTFGPKLHDVFASLYTAADRKILVELAHQKKVAAYRSTLAEWALAIAGKRNDWVYTQGSRRMDLLDRGGDPSIQRNVYGDCSSTAGALIRLACRHVGLAEPPFGDWFTTFSMINQGVAVSAEHVLCGDRIHYGANTHVGLYIGHPLVPVLSFGGEPGPEPRDEFYRPIYACRRDVS